MNYEHNFSYFCSTLSQYFRRQALFPSSLEAQQPSCQDLFGAFIVTYFLTSLGIHDSLLATYSSKLLSTPCLSKTSATAFLCRKRYPQLQVLAQNEVSNVSFNFIQCYSIPYHKEKPSVPMNWELGRGLAKKGQVNKSTNLRLGYSRLQLFPRGSDSSACLQLNGNEPQAWSDTVPGAVDDVSCDAGQRGTDFEMLCEKHGQP